MNAVKHSGSGMRTIYFASTNAGKLREFKHAAELHGINVELLPGIENLPACIEDGSTFEENARKKALYYSQWTDHMAGTNDAGLPVHGRNPRPGVLPARKEGPKAVGEQNK